MLLVLAGVAANLGEAGVGEESSAAGDVGVGGVEDAPPRGIGVVAVVDELADDAGAEGLAVDVGLVRGAAQGLGVPAASISS